MRRPTRGSALDMSPAEFRVLGHRLVEQIADFYAGLPEAPVTSGASRSTIRERIGEASLPVHGQPAAALLDEVAPLLFEHSLHNGHPRFLGYISASGAPLGALADLLAGAVNANLAKWELSPAASEIEAQAVRWLAELVGFPADGGGIMVSGGNAANIHGFLAARRAAGGPGLRKHGIGGDGPRLTAYVSAEAHTWVDKAADIAGLGADAVRWIECDNGGRLSVPALRRRIESDRRDGCLPFIVVGTAGTVASGALDPLREMVGLCREQDIWLHVDGAYGAPAACLPEAHPDLRALDLADSLALDPHKWLYSPVEAACILTRDRDALRNTFDFRPSYYHIDESADAGVDYYRQGMQNTRGFRALKVWLALRRAGLEGYQSSIREDIALARRLHDAARAHPELEARSLNLSIATFRYRPPLVDDPGYLDALNKAVLTAVQRSGNAFVSNAVVDGEYRLRACVVNFRTTAADIDSVIDTIVAIGRSLHEEMCSTDGVAGAETFFEANDSKTA